MFYYFLLTCLKYFGVLLSALIIATFVIYVWNRRHLYLFSLLKCYGPIAFPFIGNAYLIPIFQFEDLIVNLHKVAEKYSKEFPTRFWLAGSLFIPLKKPEHVKVVMNHPGCYGKTEIHNKPCKDVIGNGIGSADYELWKHYRHMLNPMFNAVGVNQFIDKFNEHSFVFVEKMKQFAGKGEVDLFPHVVNLSVDILFDAALGVKINTQITQSRYMLVVKRLFQITMERAVIPFFYIDAIFLRTWLGREHMKLMKEMDEFIFEQVRKRRKILNEYDRNTDKDKTTLIPAFLDPIFREYSDDVEIRHQVANFSFAGSDTSSTTLCFFLLILAIHKDIQEKIHAELDAVIGSDPKKPLTAEDIDKLDYLDRCLKETMRMFPLSFGVSRSNDREVEIEGVKFPPGCNFFILSYNVHRDPEYWPEPMKFDPDRFLPDEVAKRNSYLWHAFSLGPRNCLGLRYAMKIMKVELAHVLRTFQVNTRKYKSLEEIKLDWRMVISPVGGFGVEFDYRKPQETK